MNGVVVVDKPAGMTSHDVVDACRRRLGVRRIGHAGTLDPPATGVLVLGVGRAARLLRFLEASDKEYESEIVLGAQTTTDDATGGVITERDASGVTAAALGLALERFVGEIEQLPPAVSAIKVGGEALYRKARRGEAVEAVPRRVRIHELRLEGFDPGERARVRVWLRCSKGTYVRAIARDLGAALGVGGHVASLRRTAVGPFRASEAVALEAVEAGALRPMADAVSGYPQRRLSAEEAAAVARGRRLPPAGIDGPYAAVGPGGLVAMLEERDGRARALCVVAEDG